MMINKRLLNLCEDSKKYVAFTVIANWISILCNIMIIFSIGQFINAVSMHKPFDTKSILFKCIVLGILLIIRFISNMLYASFSNKASENARVTLRNTIYKKMLSLGSDYTKVEKTSAVVQVMVEGIEQLEVYFGKYLPQFFYSLLVPVTLFIFMSFISLKSAVIFILCVPVIPISIIAIMKIAKRILKDYWKSYSNLGGTFLENLQGLTTLKVFSRDEERHEMMNKEAEGFRKITMKVLSMQLNSITIMDVVAFGGAAAGIIAAVYEFMNGRINIGSLFVIILLSSEFFIPLRLLGSYFHIAMNGMAASDRIFNILDSEEKVKKIENKLNTDDDISLKLNDVSFSYDGKRNILNNINMDITRGGVTAIVGESGSGKSTIASLLINRFSADSGKVLVNGLNIENIADDDIYDNISIVSTNSYIFNGTILDNMMMAKKDVSISEIDDALRKARLFDFVQKLKDGINTNVGENGNLLSGGQKQRLALARTILADRKMIIFDEATSNIDIESEEMIWKSVYELAEEKTIVAISHRLANIRNAKEIYVLDKGCLIQKGTHSELDDNKGHYHNMLENQRRLENIREAVL